MSSGTLPKSSRTERLNTKAAGIIGLAVMCSRVLGLAREQVCAALFGGGVAMAGLVMGMLNSKSVFGIPAMASSFFNIGSIAGGVTLGAWIDPDFGPRALIGLAIGTLIGGALQFAVQLPPLSGLGFKYSPDFRWRDPGVNAILRLMGPSVIAASTTHLNSLVNSNVSSHHDAPARS